MRSVAKFQIGGFTEHPPISPFPLRARGLTEVFLENYRSEPFASKLDSVKSCQVGGFIEHPPISPLSLRERVRVRGF
jgi:hypothetical protein